MYCVLMSVWQEEDVKDLVVQSGARLALFTTEGNLDRSAKDGDFYVEAVKCCFSRRICVAIRANNRWEYVYSEKIKNGCCGGQDPNSTFKPIPFERFSFAYSSIPVVQGEMVKDDEHLITQERWISRA